MTHPEHAPRRPAAEVVRLVADLKRRNDWRGLAALGSELPPTLDRDWLPVADAVAFALGQLGEVDAALRLLESAYELEPDHRRASSLAYLCYDALLRHKSRRPRLADPEPYRKRFERWIAEALRHRPDSIVDRYRLGVYHAQVQSCKDIQALAAFRDAITLFERLPAEQRTPGNRHWKSYVRALYGAARSAYRLGRLVEARRYIFRCIRVDRERHHQKPVFKLFLAAKVLVAQGLLDDAERALRLAAEAPHEGNRDFVYALLGEVALAQGRLDDAAQWVELNIPAHHRKPYVWRLLADVEARKGRFDRALKLYKSSLLKDHAGRHRTLVRMGRLLEETGRLGEAKRAYTQAADFRRRRYLSEDAEALQALAALCERQNDIEGARRAYLRMARLPYLADRAEEALARLAG